MSSQDTFQDLEMEAQTRAMSETKPSSSIEKLWQLGQNSQSQNASLQEDAQFFANMSGLEDEFDRVLSQTLTPSDPHPDQDQSKPKMSEFLLKVKHGNNSNAVIRSLSCSAAFCNGDRASQQIFDVEGGKSELSRIWSSSQKSDADLFQSQGLFVELEPFAECEPMSVKTVFLPPSQQASTQNSNASLDPFSGLTQFRFANYNASFKSHDQLSANQASCSKSSANQESSYQSHDTSNLEPYSQTQGTCDLSEEFICSPPTPQSFPKTQVCPSELQSLHAVLKSTAADESVVAMEQCTPLPNAFVYRHFNSQIVDNNAGGSSQTTADSDFNRQIVVARHFSSQIADKNAWGKEPSFDDCHFNSLIEAEPRVNGQHTGKNAGGKRQIAVESHFSNEIADKEPSLNSPKLDQEMASSPKTGLSESSMNIAKHVATSSSETAMECDTSENIESKCNTTGLPNEKSSQMDFEKMTADHDMEDLYNDTKVNDSQQRSQGHSSQKTSSEPDQISLGNESSFLSSSQSSEPAIKTYFKDMEQELRLHLSSPVSVFDSQSARNCLTGDNARWIPSEVDNSQNSFSVRSEDVPLSDFSLVEKEFENTFGHSQSNLNISLLDEGHSDSKDSDKSLRCSDLDTTNILDKSLGPDTSFKFGEESPSKKSMVLEETKDTVILDIGSQDNLDTTEALEDPANCDTVILYSQDKTDPYDPDQTLDTFHLLEEEMPSAFIPLTFSTSFDLKQKLQNRKIIPQSQFQPILAKNQLLPNSPKLPNSLFSSEEKLLFPKRAKLGAVGQAGDHKIPSLEKDSGSFSSSHFYELSTSSIDKKQKDVISTSDLKHLNTSKKQNEPLSNRRKKYSERRTSVTQQLSDENDSQHSSSCDDQQPPSSEDSRLGGEVRGFCQEAGIRHEEFASLTMMRQQSSNLSGGFGLSDVTAPKFLNRAPRVGLSRLQHVKSLHKLK